MNHSIDDIFNLTFRNSRAANSHSIVSKKLFRSQMKCEASVSYLRGTPLTPHAYFSSNHYCRRDKCIRYRFSVPFNYKPSACNFLSVPPFGNHVLGSQFSPHLTLGNVIKVRVIVPAQNIQEKSSHLWHLQSPP